MDPSPSDAEISAWIDKGLDTVEHFLSASTQSIRSLGKSTIKPGNTEELVAAAEKVATTAAKGTQPNAKSISSEQATRPKDKQKGLLTKTPHQEQESVYEEVIPTESAPLIPKNTPKKPPRNKEKVMSMMSLSPPDESLDETQEAVFKRGGVPPPHGRGVTGQADTEGKLPSAGQLESRGSQNGATQYVTQYPNSHTGEPAGVDTVQMSAPCVKEIMHYLQTLETRIANLDWKVDKLLSQQTTITQIKNDQHTIKASLATIEGLITTIKIMDPGVGPGATASQAKRIFKEAPVVISGPILGDNPIIGAEAIQLDELARPSPAKPRQVKPSSTSSSVIVGYKSTLQSLVKECISNPSMRQKFDLAISSIKNEQDFKQVRRDIIRSAT
uniref:Phosphoprotein n=1 Tax=Tioman virus TaxID=162013 RepID=A0A2U8ZTU4_9MONO|nr:phosphoprotein [Tioman virus]